MDSLNSNFAQVNMWFFISSSSGSEYSSVFPDVSNPMETMDVSNIRSHSLLSYLMANTFVVPSTTGDEREGNVCVSSHLNDPVNSLLTKISVICPWLPFVSFIYPLWS